MDPQTFAGQSNPLQDFAPEAPALDQPRAPAGPGAARSLPARAGKLVAAHPYVAIGLILVLVIVIIYMFVVSRGWFGTGKAAKKKPKPKQPAKAPEESDAETEELISKINSSA